MHDRSVHEISEEWRAAEAEAAEPDGWSLDVEARIAALREEHGAAVEAHGDRTSESATPGFPTDPIPAGSHRPGRWDRDDGQGPKQLRLPLI